MSEDFDFLKDQTRHELLRTEMLLKLRDRRIFFATKHHVNDHGERMDFKSVPAILPLYNTLSPQVTIMGSMQSLKTEWAIVDHLAAASLGLNVFYVLPKFDTRTTFVQNRINKCIGNVDYYQSIIGDGFFDNIVLKNFGQGTCKYVGSNVPADFREYPADIAYVDEVDECDIKQLEEMTGRLGNSKYRFERYLGNPADENAGVHAKFKDGTQNEWEAICEKCEKHTELDWFKTVVEAIEDSSGDVVNYVLRDREWNKFAKRDIRCICPRCGGPLLRFDGGGQWIPQNPNAKMESWHFTKLVCNVYYPVTLLWELFQKAQGDPSKIMAFYKRDLGLPFKGGETSLTKALLDLWANQEPLINKENYAHVSGDCSDGPCTMGIDVKSDVFDVRVSDVSAVTRRAVLIGKVKGQTELEGIAERYSVQTAVIDSEPEVRIAEDFQDALIAKGIAAWRCKYPPTEGRDIGIRKDFATLRVTVDRTVALDRSLANLRAGRNLLPENYSGILSGQYLAEMTASVRKQVSDTSGNTRYIWTKCEDHARHADFYDWLAGELAEVTVITKAHVV